jgi:superfamily II RNA helicase
LSPYLQDWANELEYVVFDEVHMIARDNGEEEYESMSGHYVRILSLIGCPFLALSASISNPDMLSEWLSSIHKQTVYCVPAMERKVTRWSHLHLHYLNPETSNMFHINPVALVRSNKDLPQITELSAVEALQIYEAMTSVITDEQLNRLKPEVYFAAHNKNNLRITSEEEHLYAKDLLQFFSTLAEEKQQTIQAILLPKDIIPSTSVEPKAAMILNMMKMLQSTHKSPAILFHFDLETSIENLKEIVNLLEVQQHTSNKKFKQRSFGDEEAYQKSRNDNSKLDAEEKEKRRNVKDEIDAVKSK